MALPPFVICNTIKYNATRQNPTYDERKRTQRDTSEPNSTASNKPQEDPNSSWDSHLTPVGVCQAELRGTHSAAECELMGCLEAMTLGDSASAVLDCLEGGIWMHGKGLKGDLLALGIVCQGWRCCPTQDKTPSASGVCAQGADP